MTFFGNFLQAIAPADCDGLVIRNMTASIAPTYGSKMSFQIFK